MLARDREGVHTVSTSLHSLEELQLELLSDADYAFLSPIFDSVSKSGYSAAFDRDQLASALTCAKCPVYALGGMRFLALGIDKHSDSHKPESLHARYLSE